MMKDFLTFMGVSESYNGEANNILNNIVYKIFGAFQDFLEMDYTLYNNIDEMINSGILKDNEHSYFWSWFQEHGKDTLPKILNLQLEDTEEILDCLDQRLYILEADIENKLVSNFFESIAGSIFVFNELIETYSETAVTITISKQFTPKVNEYYIRYEVEVEMKNKVYNPLDETLRKKNYNVDLKDNTLKYHTEIVINEPFVPTSRKVFLLYFFVMT